MSLTAERLREVLQYYPLNGLFTWRVPARRRPFTPSFPGDFRNNKGYLSIRVDGKTYMTHRLVWLYVYGCWPTHNIDHINGIRDDNRLHNLREATNAENQQNRIAVGACFAKGKWEAAIRVTNPDGPSRRIFLGRFVTKEGAHQAYLAAKAEHHKFQPTLRGHTKEKP